MILRVYVQPLHSQPAAAASTCEQRAFESRLTLPQPSGETSSDPVTKETPSVTPNPLLYRELAVHPPQALMTSSTPSIQTRSREGRRRRKTWACCLGQMAHWEQMPGRRRRSPAPGTVIVSSRRTPASREIMRLQPGNRSRPCSRRVLCSGAT